MCELVCFADEIDEGKKSNAEIVFSSVCAATCIESKKCIWWVAQVMMTF